MADRTPLHDVHAREGASFVEDAGWQVPAHYGDPLAEYRYAREHAAVFDLSHHGKVELTGPEARSFLHNLSTNDVKGLPPQSGCEAFLATVQARIVAHVLVDHRLLADKSDTFLLHVAPGLAEKLVKHLDHFLISEQVEITDRTREFARLHLAGPAAKTVLEQAGGRPVPELVDFQSLSLGDEPLGACEVRYRLSLGLPGYDLISSNEHATEVWSRLIRAGARPGGLEAYEILRVEAGTPVYGKDMDETNLAPEVGRIARTISYTKGCFLGQEPIVRIRDLGHLNRTLLGLKVAGEGPVPRGAKLFREGKEAGQVTSSVVSPRLGTTIALAYVRRGSDKPGTAVEVDVEGTRRSAEVTALPMVS